MPPDDARRFNPSPGLNVFQTRAESSPVPARQRFQSLTWVERLSDPVYRLAEMWRGCGFNPSPGLNVFQTGAAPWLRRCAATSFNPSPGLNVFQTWHTRRPESRQ